MATTTEPTSPRSVVPGSPVKGDSHDVNAIVEDATKKFNDMDEQIKTLIQELKDQTAAMSKLNETRFTVRDINFQVNSLCKQFAHMECWYRVLFRRTDSQAP